MSSEPALIGIDWGTTHLRGFRIDAEGRILAARESPCGISAVTDGQFESPLSDLLGPWKSEGSKTLPIIMCGMIGSRNGWDEVPYQPCPADLASLAHGSKRVDGSAGRLWIVGGISTVSEHGEHDAMRGEETQVLGVPLTSKYELVISPGTHSKWMLANETMISAFRTYMTGEIYSLLRESSTLRWTISGDDEDPDAFLDGIMAARRDPDLLHAIFGIRTRGLFGSGDPKSLASYLSGLLIGNEVQAALKHFEFDQSTIVSSARLGRLYRSALEAHGLRNVHVIDSAAAVARGLWRIWQTLRHHQ